MKTRIILWSILQIFLSLNCCSQVMIKTTTEKENLKGNVKSIIVRNNDNNFIKLYFDRKGLLIRKETPYLLFDNYIYDKKGKLLSYKLLVKSTNSLETEQMTYDKNGFLINSFFGDCENDSYGNCISEKRSYGEIKRIYNEKNQVVEDWIYYGENHIIHSWGVDENGKHWEEDKVLPPESPHIKYQYNESGDVIFRQINDADKILTDTITYKYDEKGNWIERNQTNLFGGDSAIGEINDYTVKRDIEYYD